MDETVLKLSKLETVLAETKLKKAVIQNAKMNRCPVKTLNLKPKRNTGVSHRPSWQTQLRFLLEDLLLHLTFSLF